MDWEKEYLVVKDKEGNKLKKYTVKASIYDIEGIIIENVTGEDIVEAFNKVSSIILGEKQRIAKMITITIKEE